MSSPNTVRLEEGHASLPVVSRPLTVRSRSCRVAAHYRALLLDAWVPNAYGGTGECFNWDLAAAVALSRPVILAGGLNVENVADAIAQVQPYAVDVSSGVEQAPGKKDHAKVAAFIRAAKGNKE